MAILDQLLAVWPDAYVYLPFVVFLGVVVLLYFLMRSSPQVATEAAAAQELKTIQAVTAVQAKEQRHGFRRHGNPVEVLVAAPDDKENPTVGSLLDRSVGGMRLALFHEIKVGSVLAIRPVHADSIVPWIDLEVRSCRPSVDMPDHYDVGCQYVKVPPYSIQLLFG